MDFRDTPEEAAFRKEVRDWLDGNVDPGMVGALLTLNEGRVELLKAWQAKLHEGGWAGISWPKEYGGRGASLLEQAIFYQEMAREAPEPDQRHRPGDGRSHDHRAWDRAAEAALPGQDPVCGGDLVSGLL